jgi:ABC-2 type transport system permease protein
VSLLASELVKLRTLRTPFVLLLVVLLLSGTFAAAIVGSGSLTDDRALELAQAGAFLGLLATVVGALLVTNEYRHGTITTTFLAEPRRTRVLGAKVGIALLAGVGIGLAAALVIAAVALPWLAARDEALTLDLQAAEAVGRLVVSFALATALGAAVGAIVQSQVGTIVIVFVWFLVLENLVTLLSSLLFGELGEPDPVSPYLPGSALGGIVGGEGSDFMLRAGPAILLTLAYVAGLSLLGALAMSRRDP